MNTPTPQTSHPDEDNLYTPQIIGIDLSITATGITTPDGPQLIQTKSTQDDLTRYRTIIEAIQQPVKTLQPDLIVIEAPIKTRQSNIRTHALHGIVRWTLQTEPLIYVVPSTLKKYATGKGNANKIDMIIAARERLKIDTNDDNIADSAWLYTLGLDLLNHPPVTLPKTHRQAMDTLYETYPGLLTTQD